MATILDRHDVQFLISFIVRLLNAFCTVTFFQPDEYFQAWEPAYADVYGIGFRSWEWQAGIRTSLMPRLFAAIIRISCLLKIDYLILGKIFMAAMAASVDIGTALISKRLVPTGTELLQRTSWIVSLFSFFHWYCITRPFSNTIEMALVVWALVFWRPKKTKSLIFSQILGNIAISLRPSNAFFWIVYGGYTLVTTRTAYSRVCIAIISLFTTLGTQLAVAAIDQNYYSRFTLPVDLKFVAIEFLRHNFGSRVSEIYGVMPWHYYFTQGLPFLLLGYIPLFAAGLFQTPRKLILLIGLNLGAFSLIAHKEFRFIYYLLPLLHVIVAIGVRSKFARKWLILLAGFVNVIIGVYFSMFHQRGVIDVISHIRDSSSLNDISFLMPCHSTPWHSHFQRREVEFTPQFLTCEPPWNRSKEGYIDEADQFYTDPSRFLIENPKFLSSVIVAFEPLLPMLAELGYQPTAFFANGLFNEDRRRQGRVVVLNRIRKEDK